MDLLVERTAAEILGSHRIMALSTIRPDGWPQTTLVGYANDDATLYFVVYRASQKFRNIAAEPRVSLAIGEEPRDMHVAQALYAGAIAGEITDPDEGRRAWDLIGRRHTNLASASLPDPSGTAIMQANCRHLSVVDYTRGLGHTDAVTLGED